MDFTNRNEFAEVELADSGQALGNPGMGWILFYYDNGLDAYGNRLSSTDTVDDFPGLTTVYFRIPWAYLEPEENVFAWSLIDGPAQRWIQKGKKIALRVTCCEGGNRFATPEWVHQAGATGYWFECGQGVVAHGSLWEPDYNDPIFLAKLDRFVEALAQRYDGHPSVASVDVGSFGIWGEGHNFWSTKKDYDAETVFRHLDLYKRHFKKTLLLANDAYIDHGRGERTIEYARKLGLGFRDDSILVEPGDRIYFTAHLAQGFWEKTPVTLESQHYGMSVKDGVWADGDGYRAAMEDYHASYMGIHWYPREFYAANKALVDTINLRLGYRLLPSRLRWTKTVQRQTDFKIEMRWANLGVAPCLPGGHIALTLKDSNGGIHAVFVVTEFNVCDLPPGKIGEPKFREIAATFRTAITLGRGEYSVFVSVGDQLGTPEIALPLEDGDGARRYRLGAVEVID